MPLPPCSAERRGECEVGLLRSSAQWLEVKGICSGTLSSPVSESWDFEQSKKVGLGAAAKIDMAIASMTGIL